jgi:prevent-host-death family protein
LTCLLIISTILVLG